MTNLELANFSVKEEFSKGRLYNENYQDNKYLTMMGLKGKMCVKCYKYDKINFVMS